MQEHVSQEISRQVKFFTASVGGGKEEEEKEMKKGQPHPVPAVSQCI
jgi:hypothetical protein